MHSVLKTSLANEGLTVRCYCSGNKMAVREMASMGEVARDSCFL